MTKHGGWSFHALDFFFKKCASDLQRQVLFLPHTKAQQTLFVERAKANGYTVKEFNPEILQHNIVAVLNEKK